MGGARPVSGTRRAIGAVLVVDDDAACRDAMRTLLEDEGHRVICAADGVAALGAMRAEEIFLVLLDARMPEMDGPELRKRQLADVGLCAIPVVLVTADAALTLDDAVVVLRKPFEADALLRIVATHAESHASREDSRAVLRNDR